MANSLDPDEMLHSAASHLGLHCLLRPACPNIVNTVLTTFVLVEKKNTYTFWFKNKSIFAGVTVCTRVRIRNNFIGDK